jgi:hypothetical protein
MKTKSSKIRTIASIIILIVMAFCCQTGTAGVTPQVNTDKNVYNYGETIKANFSNAPGGERDWICIVAAGSPDNEAGDYKYMPQGVAQGVLTFAPPSPGEYELRAYYNYARKGYVVSARYAFSVASSPDYEKMAALRMELMERKIDPNNPLEANLLPGKGLVYIFREPWAFTGSVDVQIKANGKPIVVMPNSNYYLFSVPAGDVNFTTGSLFERNFQTNNREEVWSVRTGETTIKVKPGYVYYLKVRVIAMGGNVSFLDNVPHQEGTNFIDSYKLTLLK